MQSIVDYPMDCNSDETIDQSIAAIAPINTSDSDGALAKSAAQRSLVFPIQHVVSINVLIYKSM